MAQCSTSDKIQELENTTPDLNLEESLQGMHDPAKWVGKNQDLSPSIQRDLGRRKPGCNLVMEGKEKGVQSESKMLKQVPAGSLRLNLTASSVFGSIDVIWRFDTLWRFDALRRFETLWRFDTL